MNVRKRAGIRLLSVLAAAAVATAAFPAQLFMAAEEIPIEPAAVDELATYANGQNLLAGLEWTTDIPDTQFIYGQGPGVKPAIKGWLTDGVYDDRDYVDDGAKVVGFNTPGYLEFDMGENKTFRQVKITSATTQSFQTPISVFSQMKVEVYMNGSWEVVCDARDLPYESLHTYILGCTGDNTVTASKIRFYFEPKLQLRFNVFTEIEVLEEAPTGGLDGEMIPPTDPTEIVNLSQGKPYTIRREEPASYPDTNGTELTDGVLGTQDFNDPAWSGCSYGGSMSGKVYDRWPLRSVIIDLGGTKSVTQIQANFLSEASKDIFQPRSIRTFASMDGENWMPLSRLNNIATYATGIQTYGWHVNGDNGVAVDLTGDENSIVLANYIRFDLEKFSWNFMDEVTVMGYDGVHSQALPVENTTKLDDGEIQRADDSTGNIHDMVLAYNGYGHREWSVDRFKRYLTYVDQNGVSQDTLFDAAMFLGLDAPGTSGQAFATENDQITAEGWEWYLDKTFNGENSDIAYLNEAARKASEDLNLPDYKIKMTVMIPYPPSKATNFGSLGGRSLNLSQEADWQYAIDWYIGQVQDYIQNGNYQYIDFVGYYWVNEYPDGIPKIQYASEKVHAVGEKFYWIPYFSSVGYFWNDDLGFDAITLQPNHFFADPNDNTFGAGGTTIIGTTAKIGAYAGLGVEMEFDGRLATDVEKYNQGLDYLNGAVEFGFDGPEYYRNWYEGGGALGDCADSRIPVVREFYDNIYQLINGTYQPREYITSLADADPDNVLFGKSYTTSLQIGDPNAEGGPQGNYVGDDKGVRLTDGIYTGQNYHSSVGNLEFADFTFDLGSSKMFQEITVDLNAGYHGIMRPSKLQVQVSNDSGSTWQTIFDGDVDNSEQSSRVFTYRTPNGEKIVAQYIRVNAYFNSGSSWISFNEIKALDKNTGAAADGFLTVPSGQPDPAETPTITTDLPETAEAILGLPFTLKVEANVTDGGTLSYQWYKSGTAIGDNSNALTISDAQEESAGTYSVVITNTLNGVTSSVTSTSCKVNVTDNNNVLKGVKYVTSWKDGGANAGLGEFHDEHPDVDRVKLTDGLFSTGWADAVSVGYNKRNSGQPLDLTFHLSDTPKSFEQIKIGAFSPNANGILLPSNVKIEIRNTAIDDEWKTICDASITADLTKDKRFVFTSLEDSSFEATDIRFNLQFASSWMFLDEIEVLRKATLIEGDPDGILKEQAPPAGQNIALGRPYSTSYASPNGKFYPSNPDENYELTNGVKATKSKYPIYMDKEWTGYLYPDAVTIGFDFGEIATFTAVKTHIYTASEDAISTAQSYTVQVSNDGIRWTTVYDGSNTVGQAWLTYQAPEEGVRGRFVRVTMKTGTMLFLDEIEVWGEGGKELEPEPDPDTVANQAKGKAYYLYASNSNSLTFPDADKAAWPDLNGTLLTDGTVDESGDWQQNQSQWVSWKKDSGEMNVTAIFDLQAEKAIHEISTAFVQDADNNVKLPSNMQVWVSNQVNGDQISWIKMFDTPVVPSSNEKVIRQTYSVPEIYRARYVKLVFRQTSDYMGLGEIVINGKGNTTGAADPIDLVTQGMTNLSEGKPYLSSNADSTSKLTDGKFGSADASDKAWSEFGFKPGGAQYVQIDLNDTYMVSKLSVNFLTKSGSTIPENVQFIVSQDGENWKTVYNGKKLGSSSDTYKLQTLLGEPVKARYVMCYLYGVNSTSRIDEIEVSGDGEPVEPDVTPPTPPVEVKNYAIPGEATGNISNLLLMDTSLFIQILSARDSEINFPFDGIALTGDPAIYSEMLTSLNKSGMGQFKIVLAPKDASEQSLNDLVTLFENGSFENLELSGILLPFENLSAKENVTSYTSLIHQKGLKAFWTPAYNASGIEAWKDCGIDAVACRAGSSSNLSAAANTAKENGLGMVMDLKTSYNDYLNYADASVSMDFQGKYVFRAYDIGLTDVTMEQDDRMLESVQKMMKGTLKTSNRTVSVKPVADQNNSTWIGLKSVNGYEYSMDGSNWTIDPVFTNLSPETKYTFYQRLKETHSAEAALMSEALTVTTPKTPENPGPAAPIFTTNLDSSKSVKEGDKVTLTVTVTVSDGGTLSYQWYKNNQAISGATTASYTIDSIANSDEGSYKVIATNTLNGTTATATSNVCAITVETPAEPGAPTFSVNLSGARAAKVGDQVTLAVTAISNSGKPLSYQWYKNGQAISGATEPSYTIHSASISDSGVYYVDVMDKSNGTHTASNACTLTVTEESSSGGSTGGSWGGGTTTKPDAVVGIWKQLSDGKWQYVVDNKPTTGWKSVNSNWYYFNSDGIMQTGWFKDGGRWYYLRDSGAMATGWIQVNGTWYYLRDNGSMATGWQKLGNTWYFLKSNGAMQTGWLKDGNTWYYLRDSGAMQTGWLQLGNTWYYLKSSGAMATGWNWVGNKCYYFYDSGKMAANTTIGGYKVNQSGAWVQ